MTIGTNRGFLALLWSAALAVAIGCAGCGPNAPPSHARVERAFFCCAKCDSLDGGIYGKGPTQSLRSPAAEQCRHDWRRVSREQFMELARDNFGVDWAKEAPWWTAQGPRLPTASE